MRELQLSPPLLVFVVGTRAALAFGAALLLADRIPKARRKRIGLTLVAIGAATSRLDPSPILAIRSRTSSNIARE